ncbi:hypothetical protein BpHYR1_019368 [Brachionus plicatilis]|uniref:Uncharacterized protein n=1 Tax=Brachionus plicatilis TaxID=10195 RepID=A0A3M7R230_BRAPC|nr:hypothetical protein BpHYR1_019368 [Brachionus plicatilis]
MLYRYKEFLSPIIIQIKPKIITELSKLVLPLLVLQNNSEIFSDYCKKIFNLIINLIDMKTKDFFRICVQVIL